MTGTNLDRHRARNVFLWAALLLTTPLVGPNPSVSGQPPPPSPMAETLELQTTDGVQLNAVYYPAAVTQGATPPTAPVVSPIVIVLHDLGGSSESVAGLALALQKRGIAVVTPDLRGHGGSIKRIRGAAGAGLDVKGLRKPDFEAMVHGRGGRLREQAAIRGDVETIHAWIKEEADRGVFDMKRFFVVGSGIGAAVAAGWTVEDAAWPDIVSGPQGRSLRGLVMISPTWTTRGFTLAPALSTDIVKREVPILLIASSGENSDGEKDADRLFDQLKRSRPNEWYQQKPRPNDPQGATAAAPPKKSDTLFFVQVPTAAKGDSLATLSGPSGDVAGLIAGFMAKVAPAGK